ncbi:acyltransferase family protein [Paenibacillus sp. HJL G12]|uniref:Acyltransferase family protein n=2 Tax=Paenibacillus dendrobii TaxID=2691084 RepID=A0A7X3II47_9BACL|nr:acyltransferase family protein [Paenibacillus dendrobii]
MGNGLPIHRVGGKRYMPGLDGLRALSVIAVIAYHLNMKWAQGGLIGVGIFFVISGYLITDQIIQEWKRHQSLNLVDFWIRRARRLLPGMLAMMLFVALWLLCTDSGRLLSLKGAFLSSLFYVNNWWLIFHQVSYFESFGPPSPIGHLWSLSIEEQFYVVWPIALVIGLQTTQQRGKLSLLILTLACVSAIAMAMGYVPGTDPSRVYYGTDTRMFALLIGAALAVLCPSRKMNDNVAAGSRVLLDLVGSLGLTILIFLIYRTNEYDDFLYRYGFLFIALITAAVIAVLAHPASLIGKIMGCKPLRWIGVRSYSLYIWHYPVIVLSSPAVNTSGTSIGRTLLQLAASLMLAALSYRYIEEPLRRGGFRRNRKTEFQSRRRLRPLLMAAILPVIVIPVACNMVFSSPEPAQEEEKPSVPVQSPAETIPDEKKPVPDKIHSGKGVTAIGDSVILDAAPFLEKMLPGIVVSGKVGRQMRQAQDVIDQLKSQDRLAERVIIELGTNGPFNTKQLRSLLDSLKNAKQVILVNTRVPRTWQDTVNKDIAEVSNDFGNTAVVDWYSASEGKDDYFYRDGVHLKREGAEYYASILVKALE